MAINAGTVTAFLELNTSKFGKGLSDAKSQLMDAASDFKKAFDSASSASISSRLSNIGSGFKNLGSSVSSVGQSITTNVSKPLAVAGGAAIKMAMDFETGMAKISTLLDQNKVPLSEFGNGLKKISTETGESLDNLTAAAYDALSSNISSENALSFTKVAAKGAVAGQTDTNTMVNGLTNMKNAWNMSDDEQTMQKLVNDMVVAQDIGKASMQDIANYTSNVAFTASQAGISAQDVLSVGAAATSGGLKYSEVMNGLNAALGNIITPSGPAKEAAEALGLNFDVASMKAKGFMPFLEDIRAKLEQSAPAYVAAGDKVNELEGKIKAAEEGKKETAEQYKAEIQAENDAIDELQKQKDKAVNSVEKKQIEAEIEAHKEKIKTLKKESEQAKESYSPEQIQQWKQELKEAKKQQESLEGASKDKLSGWATLFGSIEGLRAVMAVTSDTGEGLFKKSKEQMNDGNDYAGDAYNTMSETTAQKLKKAMASIKVAAVNIGGTFLLFVAKLAEGVSSLVNKFNELPKPIQTIVGYSLAFVAAGGPVINIIGKMISLWGSGFTLLSKIPRGISKVTGAFSKIGPSLLKAGSGITGAIKVIASGAVSMGSTVISGVRTAGSALAALPGLANPYVLAAVAVIALLGFAAYEIYKHWDKIGPYFKKVWSGIRSVFSTGWNWLKGFIKNWGPVILAAVVPIVGIPLLIMKNWDKIVPFFSGISTKTQSVLKKLNDYMAGSVKGWGMYWDEFKQKAAKVSEVLKDSLKGLGMYWDEFKDNAKKALDVGKAIGEGLLNGLKSTGGKIIGWFKDTGSKMIEAIKEKLDMHSPSRVFTALGINTGEGYLGGLKLMENPIVKQIGNYGQLVTSKIKSMVIPKRPDNLTIGNSSLKTGAMEKLRNSMLNFNPKVTIYVTVADTGEKGTAKLTKEIDTMARKSLKNGLIDMFTDDAVRN